MVKEIYFSIYPSIKAFQVRQFATLNHPYFCGNRLLLSIMSLLAFRLNYVCSLLLQTNKSLKTWDVVSAPWLAGVWYAAETILWEGTLAPRDTPVGFCLCVHRTTLGGIGACIPLGGICRVVKQGTEVGGVFLIAWAARLLTEPGNG